MDALTNYTPVPSLRGGATALLPSNPQHLLKSSFPYPNLSASKPSSSLSLSSSKPASFLLASLTPHPPPPTFTSKTHHRAATGYAAALIDFSRRGGNSKLNALSFGVKHVEAVVATVLEDSSMDAEERVRSLRASVEGGDFDRRLVALVKMVVAKPNGLTTLIEVFKEFWKTLREITAAEEVEVVVASERKMGVRELAKVAQELQRARGVAQVKIKHLFGTRDRPRV